MADLKCLVCNKPSAKECTTCKSVRYCSEACQELDAPVHETLCEKFSNLPPRPNTSSKLGILLPANHGQPKLIWVNCPRVGPSDFSTLHSDPAINSLLGNPHGYEPFISTRNEVSGYTLKHQVVLYARDNWLNDGSKPNQAALALTDWELPYDWRGNILIMSYTLYERPGGPMRNFLDVTLEDLRAAVDYLSLYGVEIQRGAEHSSLTASIQRYGEEEHKYLMDLSKKTDVEINKQAVKGVCFRCKIDFETNQEELRSTKSLELYETSHAMRVLKSHPMWKTNPLNIVQFSKIMGLPLVINEIPALTAWNEKDMENPLATALNIIVDPNNVQFFGTAQPEWRGNVGSVSLFRKDGKELRPDQAWALAEFMHSRVAPAFAKIPDPKDDAQRRAAVLKMVNWTQFETWLEVQKASGKLLGVRSPFGMREDSYGRLY